MSKEINHWCVLCGKGYHACDSCGEVKSFTPWRILADTQIHFIIFKVLKDYNNKTISKEEARRLLENVDLSDKDTFKDNAKKILNEIFAEENVAVNTPKKRITKIKQEKITESDVEESGSEDVNNYE